MLYELTTFILCLLLPYLVIISYRQGVKDGRAIKKDKPLQPVIQPFMSATPETDERLTKIMDNINSYDGTERGQVDV